MLMSEMFCYFLKFIYSEKATKFCTVDLSYVLSASQIYSGDFAKFCGLLRIYELYRDLEIVMNELRRFKHSADFLANSSHIIESAVISAS